MLWSPSTLERCVPNTPLVRRLVRTTCRYSRALLCVSPALDKAIGEIINIASAKEHTVKEIAESIIKITKSKSKIVFLEPLKGDPMRNKADVSKASNILEFQADYDLQRGLEYINKKLF